MVIEVLNSSKQPEVAISLDPLEDYTSPMYSVLPQASFQTLLIVQ
jgi:hypothetical protein